MAGTQQVWVLGGGGVAGIAWEIGMLAGLADEGVAVDPAATLIGTSAGAVVAAQLTSGLPVEQLYEHQIAGVPYELSARFGVGKILRFTGAQLFARTPEAAGRRIGRAAIAADVGRAEDRMSVVEARLPDHSWHGRDLRIVAVDAESGAARVFTKADGVPLVDAVAASCAIPLSWPPVPIEGHLYVDGGMRSTLNLDLAPGVGPVIALAPSTAAFGSWARIRKQRALLGADRAVVVLTHDRASKSAQGINALDPANVPAIAAAGRAQGQHDAESVSLLLHR